MMITAENWATVINMEMLNGVLSGSVQIFFRIGLIVIRPIVAVDIQQPVQTMECAD